MTQDPSSQGPAPWPPAPGPHDADAAQTPSPSAEERAQEIARHAASPQGRPGEYHPGHPEGTAHYAPAHYAPAYYAPPSNAYTVQARSPILYCLIDFLVTGLGLMLQGRALLGATFLVVTLICFPLTLIPFVGWLLIPLVILPIGVISMILAFTTATSWNRRHGIIT